MIIHRFAAYSVTLYFRVTAAVYSAGPKENYVAIEKAELNSKAT
jgi:hypothetical protein